MTSSGYMVNLQEQILINFKIIVYCNIYMDL